MILAVVGVLLVALMVRQGRTTATGGPGAGSTGEVPGVGVGAKAGRVLAEGRVEVYPGARVELSSEVRGLLTNVLVQEKSRVTKGDLLAEIAADDVWASWLEARAQVGEIEAEAALARSEVGRGRKLSPDGVITAQERERLERHLEWVEARLATAQIRVRRLEITLGKTRIMAPFSGVILGRHLQPGEVVVEGRPLLTLADLGRVRVEAEVDEFDAGRMTLGAAVVVRAEGHEEVWRGRIEEIPDSVGPRQLHPQDPASPSDVRVLRVKVALEDRGRLKLGQRVEVEIESGAGGAVSQP